MTEPNESKREDLQPWMLIGPSGPECWRLEIGKDAVTMFSSEEAATCYREEHCGHSEIRVIQPSAMEAVRTLMACVEADVCHGVLDPRGAAAQRVFDLREILRKVRSDLRSGLPLSFSN